MNVEELISRLQKIMDDEGIVPVSMALGTQEGEVDSVEFVDESLVIEGNPYD